jgi:uncharacterized protein (TIGR00106 family)
VGSSLDPGQWNLYNTSLNGHGIKSISESVKGGAMNVIIDLCVVPLGVGLSVSKYVAACHEIIEQAGLSCELHAYGTNIEGAWDEVFAVVKQCHERIHAMGAPRITTTIKVGTRTDREQTMADKIQSVKQKLA